MARRLMWGQALCSLAIAVAFCGAPRVSGAEPPATNPTRIEAASGQTVGFTVAPAGEPKIEITGRDRLLMDKMLLETENLLPYPKMLGESFAFGYSLSPAAPSQLGVAKEPK